MAARLSSLRDELRILDEQHVHLANDADEARLAALVSETPLADRAHRHAARHASTAAVRRDEVRAQIDQLESEQDQLLDELTGN